MVKKMGLERFEYVGMLYTYGEKMGLERFEDVDMFSTYGEKMELERFDNVVMFLGNKLIEKTAIIYRLQVFITRHFIEVFDCFDLDIIMNNKFLL